MFALLKINFGYKPTNSITMLKMFIALGLNYDIHFSNLRCYWLKANGIWLHHDGK